MTGTAPDLEAAMNFLIFLLATAAAGATGMFFQPGSWYAGLQKPGLTLRVGCFRWPGARFTS